MAEGDASTTSPTYGCDFRWYFSKSPIRKKELSASVPKIAIASKEEFMRFSEQDSLLLETAFLKREDELLAEWWKEFAECSDGPTPRLQNLSSLPRDEDESGPDWLDPYSNFEEIVGVPVKGGLYEVDLLTRKSSSVYWGGVQRRVLRGTWYALFGSHWLPLREELADQLEVAFKCKVWRNRGYEPSGLYAAHLPLSGFPQDHYALFTGEDSNWEAWLVLGDSWHHNFFSYNEPGIPVRRGFKDSDDFAPFTKEDRAQQMEEEFDDYCSQVPVSHLVFMVHGIGQKMSSADLVQQVHDFRTNIATLSQTSLTKNQRMSQRCLFIPVQWRRGMTLGSESLVEDITLEGVKPFRRAVSETVHDVLYYMSHTHCQDIVDSVTLNLNFLFRKFKRRNPDFNGKVSVYGHSLGSVLLHDILCHQKLSQLSEGDLQAESSDTAVELQAESVPTGAEEPEKTVVLNEVESGDQPEAIVVETGDLGGVPGVKESQHSQPDSTQLQVAMQSTLRTEKLPQKSPKVKLRATRRQNEPVFHYDKLDFEVDSFFAVGSPLGLFLALRKVKFGSAEASEAVRYEMPAVRHLLNIFHPFDPVAYRIEPIISRKFLKLDPVLAPHFKGRKRLHIAIKELQRDAWEAVRRKWRKLCYSLHCFQVQIANFFIRSQSRKIDPGRFVEDSEGQDLNLDENEKDIVCQLTGSERGRIDHCLQESTLGHQYIVALQCHMAYWSDKDTALLILQHLFRDIPRSNPGKEEPCSAVKSRLKHQPTSSKFDFEEDDQVALSFQSGGKIAMALADAFRTSCAADPLRVKDWGLAL